MYDFCNLTIFQVSMFEKEKARNNAKRNEMSTWATENSAQETKPVEEPVNSNIDKTFPATKTADNDADRKKFFQSLLQSKNGPKVDASLPNTIPEENESNPSSHLNEGKKASEDDSSDARATGVTLESIPSNQNGDEKLESSEDRPSDVEDSLSSTGLSSEVRGAEVADEVVNQGTGLPDKGLDVGNVGENEAEKMLVTGSDVEENAETETVEKATNSAEGNKLTGNSQVEQQDVRRTKAENETEESIGMLPSNESDQIEKLDNWTENDSSQQVENTAKSKVGEDLLSDKDKPKDVDNFLTIAVKSSYIGAAVEESEDKQTSGVNGEGVDSGERVVSASGIIKSERQNALDSERGNIQNSSVDSLPGTDPSQPNSASSPSKSGAESSPGSTPAAPAATNNADSPEQKSTYRAHVNIPEYLWTPVHQRLLGDLLFAIESDVQVWRR